MLADKIAINVLEEFLKKVRLAAKTNQKEIKLSVNEAEDIAYNMNILILKYLDKNQNTEKSDTNEIISINMDGGSFDERG